MSRYYNDELYHYGVVGMKWGIRKYVDANGKMTNAGYSHYGISGPRPSWWGSGITNHDKQSPGYNTYLKFYKSNAYRPSAANIQKSKSIRSQQRTLNRKAKATSQTNQNENNTTNNRNSKKGLSPRAKKAIVIGVAAAGTALAIYGGYKIHGEHMNMMKYQSALGNKAIQKMQSEWGAMSARNKAKAIIQNRSLARESRGGIVFDKGSIFRRTEGAASNKSNQGLYVSYRNRDRDKYGGRLAKMQFGKIARGAKQNGEDPNSKDYSLFIRNMTTKKEHTIVPSYKDEQRIFKDYYRHNKDAVKKLISDDEFGTIKNLQWKDGKVVGVVDTGKLQTKRGMRTVGISSILSKDPDKWTDKETKILYDKFNVALRQDLNGEHGNTIKGFYKKLEDAGFDAVHDRNDQVKGGYHASAPLILLNKNNSIGEDVKTPLSPGELIQNKRRADFDSAFANILTRPIQSITGNRINPELGNQRPETERAISKYTKRAARDASSLNNKITMNDYAKFNREVENRHTGSTSDFYRISHTMDRTGKSFDEVYEAYKTRNKSGTLSESEYRHMLRDRGSGFVSEVSHFMAEGMSKTSAKAAAKLGPDLSANPNKYKQKFGTTNYYYIMYYMGLINRSELDKHLGK